jgi:hypothetical protein
MTEKLVPLDRVWIVVPAFNEAARIATVLNSLVVLEANIVVVDDLWTRRYRSNQGARPR